jgi:hypothetical protein
MYPLFVKVAARVDVHHTQGRDALPTFGKDDWHLISCTLVMAGATLAKKPPKSER